MLIIIISGTLGCECERKVLLKQNKHLFSEYVYKRNVTIGVLKITFQGFNVNNVILSNITMF